MIKEVKRIRKRQIFLYEINIHLFSIYTIHPFQNWGCPYALLIKLWKKRGSLGRFIRVCKIMCIICLMSSLYSILAADRIGPGTVGTVISVQ